jgi:hypothetical protein
MKYEMNVLRAMIVPTVELEDSLWIIKDGSGIFSLGKDK